MKFRTDFVTNSSSSGFTTILLQLKNGTQLKQEIKDWPEEIEEIPIQEVLGLETVAELCQWLSMIYPSEMEQSEQQEKEQFLQEVQTTVKQMQDLAGLKITRGESVWGYDAGEGDVADEVGLFDEGCTDCFIESYQIDYETYEVDLVQGIAQSQTDDENISIVTLKNGAELFPETEDLVRICYDGNEQIMPVDEVQSYVDVLWESFEEE